MQKMNNKNTGLEWLEPIQKNDKSFWRSLLFIWVHWARTEMKPLLKDQVCDIVMIPALSNLSSLISIL